MKEIQFLCNFGDINNINNFNYGKTNISNNAPGWCGIIDK